MIHNFSNTKAADDVAMVTRARVESDANSMTLSIDESPVDIVTRVQAGHITLLYDVGRKQAKAIFASTLSDLLHDHAAWKVPG